MASNEIILKGKLIIKGKISLETALHIGGSSANLEIGGVDNAVIKTAKGVPYIPGSSLKGKLRSLLATATYELTRENFPPGKIHSCAEPNCSVCSIFGRNTEDIKKVEEPNRLIVRDAFMDLEYFKELTEREELKNLDLEYTEVKYENFIDRLTSAANPRQLERVPAGNRFNFEMVFNVYSEKDIKHLNALFSSMKLLEDDYLGGSGTRGSGKIKFIDLSIEYRSKGYYEEKTEPMKLPQVPTLSEVRFNKIQELLT
ncbi:MAG: type III-A CRISPR-associated RAMP protein Csm3 [Candidatus Heimdallarchaeota archaeon]